MKRVFLLFLVLAGCATPEPEPTSSPYVLLHVDPAMLDRYAVTMDDLVQGLRKAGFRSLWQDGLRVKIRTDQAQELARVVIGHRADSPILVRDLAAIELR